MAKKKNTKVLDKQLKKVNEFDRLAQYFLSIYMCGICVFFPLFLSQNGYVNMTMTKNNVFYTVTIAMIIAVVALCISLTVTKVMTLKDFLRIEKPDFRNWQSIADIAVLSYLLVMIISSLFSGEMKVAMFGYAGRNDGIVVHCLYILTYFIISRIYVFKQWHIWLPIAASIVVSLMSILNFYGIDPLDITDKAKRHFALRFVSTIGNINFTSWYTAMMLCLVIALFVVWKSKYVNWLVLPTALLSLSVYYLDVDSGKVAIIAMFVCLFFFCLKDRKALERFFVAVTVHFGFAVVGAAFFTVFYNNFTRVNDLKNYLVLTTVAFVAYLLVRFVPIKLTFLEGVSRWKIYLIIMGLVVAVALLTLYLLPQYTFSGFVYEFTRVLHGETDDNMGTNRMYIWKNSLKLFTENPVFGFGQDMFGKVFTERFSSDLAAVYGVPQTVDKAHNIYVQILVCTGILGFVSYMTYLVSVILKTYTAKKPDPFAIALTMAVIGYSVQAFFLFSLPFVTPFFWLFAGMIMSRKFTK